jgi:carboxylesterase type B
MRITAFTFQSLLSPSLFFSASLSTVLNAADNGSQVVDLGYARHRPTYTNTTASGEKIVSYMNIRFAQPPTGQLRFRKPVTPPPYSPGIQNGSYPLRFTDCISSVSSEVPFPDINGTIWGHEDCLFLNVLVSEGVHPGDNVPVLHWIFGSAYAFGSKDFLFDPTGLFDGMKKSPEEKFVYVASNYRYGWEVSWFARAKVVFQD